MRVDQSGSIAMTSGTDDIDSSMRMVLITAPGERVKACVRRAAGVYGFPLSYIGR